MLIKMDEKAGQMYWTFCNATALLSELKALLASTSMKPSEFTLLKQSEESPPSSESSLTDNNFQNLHVVAINI